jgi:hypothetical protein
MRRNAPLYCAVLAAIVHEAKTVQQLRQEVGCTRGNVSITLNAMHGRIAHIEAYADESRRPALWRAGNGKDAPKPLANRGLGPRSRGADRIAFVVLVQALMSGPHRQLELEQITGCHHGSVRRQLRELRQAGLIHIAAWDKPGRSGNYAAYWEWGPGKSNVAKPKRMSELQIRHRWEAASRQRRRDLQIHSALAANSTAFQQRA